MEHIAIKQELRSEGRTLDLAVQGFVYLQVLDLITTIIGLQLGATEGSPFVSLLMHAGPVTGLLLSKLLALCLAGACIYFGKRHVLRWATYWYAALVLWNLLVVLAALRKLPG